jgi:hypothetical protein
VSNPLDARKHRRYTARQFRRSSAVEQLTVNQLVVGSIPTAGAKISHRFICVTGRPLGRLFGF